MSEFKPHRGAKSYRLEQNSVKIHLIKTQLIIKSGVNSKNNPIKLEWDLIKTHKEN